MEKFASFIRRALIGVFALLTAIASRVAGEPYVVSGEAEMTRALLYNYAEGVTFMQGLASDGTTLYGFGALKPPNYNAITKIDLATGEVLQRHEMCLPRELMKKGYSHIGDGCLYEGKLYVAMEDYGFRHPAVIRYDPETLAYIDYKVVPDEAAGNGRIPWCEIADGVLYFTQSNDVDELRMLRADDMTYIGAIPLDRTLYKVQGGEMLDGRMIMVTNEGNREKNVYAVDLETGHVEVLFVRSTGKLNMEGEGITVCPTADGAVLHIVDSSPLGVRITSFALTDGQE